MSDLGEVKKFRTDFLTGQPILISDFGNYVVHFDIINKFFTTCVLLDDIKTGLNDLLFVRWLKENYEMKIIEECLYYKRNDRRINMRCQCWDLARDFDFSKHKELYNLDKIFHDMD